MRGVSARSAVTGLGLLAFGIILLRTAWISDLAYLTIRTVEHAAGGYGPRWNIAERVQVDDHPLWLLLLLGGRLTIGGSYVATMAVSIACSLAAVWTLLRQAASDETTVFVAAAAILSPLFVTFSTSGLETPLLHLLVAGIVVVALGAERTGQRPTLLAVLVGLALLTRWTSVWLVGPVLLAALRPVAWQVRARAISIAVGPVLIWLVWSVWYYGTIGPIRSLADRSASPLWRDRVDLGSRFLVESAHDDPLLVTIIVAGLAAGWGVRGAGRAVVIGGALVVVWVVATGGSPMSGRDLTAIFVAAILLLARRFNDAAPRLAAFAACGVIAVSALGPTKTYASDARYGAAFRRTTRTHDARAEDYQSTGLLLAVRGGLIPRHPEATRARELASAGGRVATTSKPGFFGAAAGPGVYVLDPAGTIDPLLARLPPAVGAPWLWGSARRVPDGYLASLPDRANQVEEMPLARLYDDVRLVTRGPLTGAGRLNTLWRLAAADDARVRESSYGPEHLTLEAANGAAPADATRALREGGISIELGQRRPITHIDATLSRVYDYEIDVLDGERQVVTIRADRQDWQAAGVAPRRLTLPHSTDATALWFRCRRGAGLCTVSHIAVD